ncbi:hypothetical protein KR009_009365, partial [Drosophila setifemur]
LFPLQVAFFACLAVAAAAPGLIAETHSYVQPAVLAKTAYVDTSASSAITHQSNVNLVHKVPLAYSAPVVHSVVPAAPLVKTVVAAPLVKTVVAAPAPLVLSAVPSAPLVKTVYSAAPLVKTVYPAAPLVSSVPVVYSAYHK